jgi:hypothetical protein
VSTVLWVSFGLLWVVVLVQSFAFVELLRQVGSMRRQLGPPQGALIVEDAVSTGAPVPPVECRRLVDGEPCRLADATGRDAVVVQLTTTCATCRAVARDLSEFARAVAGTIALVVVVRDASSDGVERFAQATGLDRSLVLVDETGAVGKATGLSWTPAAMSVRRGRLGEAAIVNDARQLETFTDRTVTAEVDIGEAPKV